MDAQSAPGRQCFPTVHAVTSPADRKCANLHKQHKTGRFRPFSRASIEGVMRPDTARMPLLVGHATRFLGRCRNESGQALVEAALTLPFLLVIVFGIAQFGITYNNYVMLTDSVRAGARQLSMARGQANPCSTAMTRVIASAPTLTSSSLTVTMKINNAATSYGGTAGGSVSCAGQTLIGGEDVQVIAAYPCNLTVFGVNYAPGGCTLSSRSTVRIE